MYKNKIIKFFLAALVLLSTSCDNWLYLEPQDAIVRQEFWKTKEQAEAALIGCYASLLDPNIGYRMFVWGELRADMISPTEQATLDEREMVNGNILETNNITDWAAFYRTINYCNTLIEYAPEVQQHDPTFRDDVLAAYIAEAKAIRSLMYFYLVRTFGEVPLKLEATVSDDQNFSLKKSSEEEIMEQIIKDLNEAEIGAFRSFGNNMYNKGRFTKAGVNALQADVYLWNEMYDDVIIATDKIITTGQYGLVAGDQSWYNTLFVRGNSSESIFELQYGVNRHPYFPFLQNVRRFAVSSHVLDEVYTLDFNNPENFDIRSTGTSLQADGRIWKYIGQSASTTHPDAPPYPNLIVYRYADVLLMKAEALVAMDDGRGAEALELIQRVRMRAKALPATNPTLDENGEVDMSIVNSKDDMIDFILAERAREFAFEGKRWFDILRNSRRNNFEREDILINMVTLSAPSDRQQSILNKYQDRRSLFLPISQGEIFRNQNLLQNGFYSRK